jgi:hypothetical protein
VRAAGRLFSINLLSVVLSPINTFNPILC